MKNFILFSLFALSFLSCRHVSAQVSGTLITVLPHTSSGAPSSTGVLTFRSLITSPEFDVNLTAPNAPAVGGAAAITLALPDGLPTVASPGGCVLAVLNSTLTAGAITCGDTPDNAVNAGSPTNGLANLYLSTAAYSPLFRVYQNEPYHSATGYYDITVTGSNVLNVLDDSAAVVYQYDGTNINSNKPIWPSVTQTYNLGDASFRWQDLYAVNGLFSQDVEVNNDLIANYVDVAHLQSVTGAGSTISLESNIQVAFGINIGSPSYLAQGIYATTGYLNNIQPTAGTTIYLNSNMLPNPTNTYSLGTSGNQFSGIFTTTLTVSGLTTNTGGKIVCATSAGLLYTTSTVC